MTAPIALFVYNRPEHTRRTVEALRANHLASDSDLFVYADAARSPEAQATVQAVREYVRRIDGFRSVTVVERETNWGVDPSVIDGVTTLCEARGEVIVLEDDLVTSRWFLTYMNRALDRYRDEERVMQVTGYMFPVTGLDETRACFMSFISSWGWATWKRAWDHFDPLATGYEKLRSDKQLRAAFDLDGSFEYFDMLEQNVRGASGAWDIRWYLSVFEKKGLTLYPQKSLVNNIGFDGSGVHCPVSDFAGSTVAEHGIEVFPEPARSVATQRQVERYLTSMRSRKPSFLQKFLKRFAAGNSRGVLDSKPPTYAE